MTDFYKELVELYAENDVVEIRGDHSHLENKFGRSLTELQEDWDFPAQKKLVQSVKKSIEMRAENLRTSTQKERIAECLNIVLHVATFKNDGETERQKKLDVVAELIELMFSEDWSEAQRTHFRYGVQLVREWKNYFISYTNGAPKVLNSKYKKVINGLVSQSTLDQRDWNNENILVDAVVETLRRRDVEGFYDRDQIEIGEDIEKEISPAAMHSFAFIQIVQPETFTQNDPNWSYEEYKTFINHNYTIVRDREIYKDCFGKRYKSMLTNKEEDQLVPPLLPFEYEPWRDRIFRSHHHKLLPTDLHECESAINSLGHQIRALQKEFFEAVPE
ncbi:MAG: hypothetical protein AAF572_29025 [Cyanobacteria bacterium P01_B01_bin.77]